jgi:hypothetical protein
MELSYPSRYFATIIGEVTHQLKERIIIHGTDIKSVLILIYVETVYAPRSW